MNHTRQPGSNGRLNNVNKGTTLSTHIYLNYLNIFQEKQEICTLFRTEHEFALSLGALEIFRLCVSTGLNFGMIL